jgi:hypothetical protein
LSPKRATKAIPREAGPPSDAELLAALIADGGEDTLPLAKTLILKWGDLFSLPATTREMLRHDGLAEGQASRLLAAAELARRLAREEVPLRRPLDRPYEVARYLALRYARRDQEIMGALFLDTRHRFLSDAELYRGTRLGRGSGPRGPPGPRESRPLCVSQRAGCLVKVKVMLTMDRGLFDLCRGIARAHGVPLDDLVEETLLAAFVGEEAFVPREQDEIDLLSRLYMPDLGDLAARRLKGRDTHPRPEDEAAQTAREKEPHVKVGLMGWESGITPARRRRGGRLSGTRRRCVRRRAGSRGQAPCRPGRAARGCGRRPPRSSPFRSRPRPPSS